MFCLEWCPINAGVPEGTLFGPIGFIIHIDNLSSFFPLNKHVDATSVWEVCGADGHDSRLQEVAIKTSKWSDNNMMSINCDKTIRIWW